MAKDFKHRLRELLGSRLIWIAVAWLASLVAAGVLYIQTPEFSGVAGVVEVVDYRVAAPETLKIVELPVEVGTRVRRGDVLATLDAKHLSLERDLVRAELDLKTAESRFREITDDRSFAQGVTSAKQALAQENLQATRVQADLDALRRRLAWWKRQVAAGTAPGREVEDLASEEAALAMRLRSHRDAVVDLKIQLKEGRDRMESWHWQVGNGSPEHPTGQADPIKAAISVAQAKLAILESRLDALTLRAPADGVVQRVDARAGDVSQAGQTVVLVREDIPRRVFAYPSASQAGMLRLGTPAWVAARDTGGTQRFPAHVVAIGPGVVPYPDVLQNRTTAAMSFGQAVILHLDGPSPLAPGQVVDVSLMKIDLPILRDPTSAADASPLPVATIPGAVSSSDPSGKTVPPVATKVTSPAVVNASAPSQPVAMSVPESISRTTRFEPSGIAWLPDRSRFIVVSDDTGLVDDSNDHAPWVFLMDGKGTLDPQPVLVQGAMKISDMESVTRTDSGELWILSSQSISRKGRRPAARTQLVQVDDTGGRFVVRHATSLASALAALDGASLDALGLIQRDKNLKEGTLDRVLNVEGLASEGSSLLVGLKQPLDASGRAIIWRIADPGTLVQTGRFAHGDPSLWASAAMSLGSGQKGEQAGISDITSLPGGGVAILGTALPGSALGDFGGLWVARGGPANGVLSTRKAVEFPGLKPEGVAVGPAPGELTIVFDENSRNPHCITIPIPR